MTAVNIPHPGATGSPQPLPPVAPLSFGQIISESFRALRFNPKPGLIGTVLIPFAINAAALLLVVLVLGLTEGAETGSIEDLRLLRANMEFSNLQSLLSAATVVFAQAYALMNLRESFLGNRPSNALIFRGLKSSWGGLLVWTVLGIGVAFAFAIVMVLVVFVVVLFTAASGARPDDPGAWAGVLTGVLIAAGVVALPFIWVMTRLSLTPAAIVIDRLPVGGALKQSWRSTRGRFWRVFGVNVVIGAIFSGVSFLIFAAFFLPVVVFADGDLEAMIGPLNSIPFGIALLSLLSLVSAVSVAVLGYSTGLLSIDARLRDARLADSLNGFRAARSAGIPAHAMYDPFVSPPEAFAPYSPNSGTR